MATGIAVAVALLQILGLCIHSTARIPDRPVLKDNAEELKTFLEPALATATNYDDIKLAYEAAAAQMTLADVNGEELVAKMASQLTTMLGRKMEALQKSVDHAEMLAMNYQWDGTLKIGDIEYVNAKEVNDSDPDYVFSQLFRQRVNFNASSVHIPVEIYAGGLRPPGVDWHDLEILNGLAWTGGMETIWQQNREDYPELLWQYFGSQTGIMRNYPASKWQGEEVDLYDVRRRPWYTQGASSPKNMLIMVDTSGSTHGQALQLMKQSVKSLLDTLGENDYVNVATFSDEAQWATCFETFVQASYRHKQVMYDYVDTIEAKGMAKYTAGLSFAFEQFEKFEAERHSWEGADCNPIIMFLTDGGTETPEEVFKKYNWPEKEVRIFTYAVGPTANPVSAVKWIACSNRGYFVRIPSMGAIRSRVQMYRNVIGRPMAIGLVNYKIWSPPYQDSMSYVEIVARPCSLAYYKHYKWTEVLHDRWGLGMMTTVTLPVYNRTNSVANQTILGVMGCDVTTAEMETFIPVRTLGPNGYSFAINNNGYIVFHPKLKAQYGWLSDPPNVDFLDIEYETLEKVALRTDMLNNQTGSKDITTYVVTRDEEHLDEITLKYSYRGIPGTNFSLAIAVPQSWSKYLESVDEVPVAEGAASLQPSATTIILANWAYCKGLSNDSNVLEALLAKLGDGDGTLQEECDEDLVQQLFFDARITNDLEAEFASDWDTSFEILSRFFSSNSGMLRVYPPSASESFEGRAGWGHQFYERSFNNDLWIFQTQYEEEVINGTAPPILVTRAVTLDSTYKPGVVGVQLPQETLREAMKTHAPTCQDDEYICYLLDDSGYIVVSGDEDESWDVGRFLGDIDPVLTFYLYNKSMLLREEEYDFQAVCPEPQTIVSAGFKSIFIPNIPNFFAEMLTLQWWTTKIAWAWMNVNFYQWFFSQPEHYAMASETESTANISCIKLLTQYRRNPDQTINDYAFCANCTRQFGATAVLGTNLLLVMADRRCGEDCEFEQLNSVPVETGDPLFADDQCIIQNRYRTKPAECYDYDVREDDTDCGRGSHLAPSLLIIVITAVFTLMDRPRQTSC